MGWGGEDNYVWVNLFIVMYVGTVRFGAPFNAQMCIPYALELKKEF